MAHEVRALDLEPVHQRDDVAGHAVDRVAAANRIAFADAATVMGDDFVALGERRDLLVPERGQPA
jgi:hypothetical protein